MRDPNDSNPMAGVLKTLEPMIDMITGRDRAAEAAAERVAAGQIEAKRYASRARGGNPLNSQFFHEQRAKRGLPPIVADPITGAWNPEDVARAWSDMEEPLDVKLRRAVREKAK
jgi:hypothetical protein